MHFLIDVTKHQAINHTLSFSHVTTVFLVQGVHSRWEFHWGFPTIAFKFTPHVNDMSGSSKQLTLFDCAHLKSAAKQAKP